MRLLKSELLEKLDAQNEYIAALEEELAYHRREQERRINFIKSIKHILLPDYCDKDDEK